MQEPTRFSRIIERKRYDVETAELIAADDYWDGYNIERRGRQTFLYKTPNGAYFTITLTQWQGEHDTLTPLSEDEAIALYEGRLTEHRVEYTEAFPGVVIVDA